MAKVSVIVRDNMDERGGMAQIKYHEGRVQPFTVWHGRYVIRFCETFEEADKYLLEAEIQEKRRANACRF